MMIFTNIRNKVTKWKRRFIFVKDTQTKRINNELAAHISEWRPSHTYMNYPTLTPDDMALKDKIVDYVKAKRLVDLEALVILEQLAMLGFVDVANLYTEACRRGSLNKLSARGAAEGRVVAHTGKHALMSNLQRHLTAHHIEPFSRLLCFLSPYSRSEPSHFQRLHQRKIGKILVNSFPFLVKQQDLKLKTLSLNPGIPDLLLSSFPTAGHSWVSLREAPPIPVGLPHTASSSLAC
ncbi:hypothetical protein SLEP1_g50342 [Rubroshorea leprosula]|uniref:LisH domain-containing protein n=1 Tax=Rubroshorea leprosula TaxID=152421 RepID=A0AAV5LZN9_9ROSI|nr:hypothetical protein SLEP1_g50342 [Rubroshorea leprosula]